MTRNAIYCLVFFMAAIGFSACASRGMHKGTDKHDDDLACRLCRGGSPNSPNGAQISAKNAVLTNSTIATYPWEPINQTKILPTTFPLPVATGNSLSIQASRGQFEPASFIIRASKALSGIQINASDLTGTGHQKIPASAVDIRLVKCWYQSGDGTITQNKTVLVPELLLRDDALVHVDTVNKMNYLKVSLNGTEQYIDISSPDAVFPDNAIIKDAKTLQPFNLYAHTNKQVWVTVHVPKDIPSGDYAGSIQITVPGKDTVTLRLSVTVLPFDLPQPTMEYSIYYRGRLSVTTPKVISSELKTADQYMAEMIDMKNHGIVSPTIYQGLSSGLIKQELDIRKKIGISGKSLYILGTTTGNATDVSSLSALNNSIRQWLTIALEYGYQNTYIYGIDEASGKKLTSQRTAWETVKSSGAKVHAACYKAAIDTVGDLLDLAILSGAFDSTTVDKWHSQGKKVFIYNNPHVGIENPVIYRKNYGLSLWLAGYEGVMDYAYQHAYGNIWNDFDHDPNNPTYRDIVCAYPTTNGVIDTIQWEGFRQGVDDVRYLTALLNKQDKATVKQWLGGQLKSNSNLGSVRKAIINKIINE